MAAADDTPKPKDAAYLLLSTFGQREMEVAAQVVCARARQARRWTIRLHDDDFTRDEMARAGWQHLKAYGWVEFNESGWAPTRKFIDRVTGTEAHEQDRINHLSHAERHRLDLL
jgi:hypothetical protein